MENNNGRDNQQPRNNNEGGKKSGGKPGKRRPYYNKKRPQKPINDPNISEDILETLGDTAKKAPESPKAKPSGRSSVKSSGKSADKTSKSLADEAPTSFGGVQSDPLWTEDVYAKYKAPYRSKSTDESDVTLDSEGNGSFDDPDTPSVSVVIETDDTPKVHVAGIRFKSTGKVYYFDPGNVKLTDGSFAIVDTARGIEYGEVAFADREVPESTLVLPLRRVLRAATPEDTRRNEENRQKEKEAFDVCLSKIASHGLDMKLVDVQYTFDNSKLLFYFTSAGRVDFRELVKDLAGVFRTRIELRQIGIRDEAKLLGGLGACGRPLCCSTFLSDFVQVSIKMAKEQNLSLNSSKISGCCGRLMCCLQYEYQTYASEAAKTPSVDSTVKTVDGIGTVTETNPLAGTVKVRLKDQPDVAPKSYHRDDVKVLSKARGGENNAEDIKD